MPGRRPAAARSTLIAAAVAVACAVPAPAGVPLVDADGVPYKWDLDLGGQPNVLDATDAVTFYVDAASLADAVNGPKSAIAAVRDGVHAWEGQLTRIRFTEDATRPAAGRNGNDRVNWIGWSRTELSAATFAATFPTRSGSRIVDADVVLNDRSFSWDTWNPGVIGDADIQALVTHEWGHAIGCEHVPLRASTMYFAAVTGQLSPRTPEPDDLALAGALYPSQTYLETTGSITGTVDVPGTSDDRAVHVVAVSVATMEPASSTLTRPDGSFIVAGLPSGAYRLIAAPCVPLGNSMNAFWRSGATTFLPAVLRDPPANPGRAVPVRVEAGGATIAGAFAVGGAASPLEPNDTPSKAAQIAVGDAVCARFESGSDEDWYAFDAMAGERITASVLAWEIGSGADPALRITDAGGTTLQASTDIRSGASVSSLAGEDRDARIAGWSPPATGRYLLRVTQDLPVSGAHGFYVLFLTVASDAPSPVLTEVSAVPDRIDAGGTRTSELVVVPRRENGAPLGGGATVTFLHEGGGTTGPVTTPGDGSYHATVTAPATPGTDVFRVRIAASTGTVDALDTATIVYVGPADAGHTTFRAEPRRVGRHEAAVLRFTPRDAGGEPLGAARAVSFSLAPDLGVSIGPLQDDGTGTYTATLASSDVPGAASAAAAVDLQGTVATAPFAVGFALTDVLAAAAADVAAFRTAEGLPKRATKAFAAADARIVAALAAASQPSNERKALVRTRSALLSVRSGLARAGSRLEDPGTPRELALSIRESVEAALGRAASAVRNDRDQRRLDRARGLSLRGSDRLAAGNAAGAAASWLRAYAAVAPILRRA